MITGVSADYYYGGGDIGSGTSITDDTDFSLPQYESQQEILTLIVLPFIFISVILRYAFVRALHLSLADGRDVPALYHEEAKPDVSRESTVMALAATGILVPSPMWNYVVWVIQLLDSIVVLAFAGIVLFVLYLMAS